MHHHLWHRQSHEDPINRLSNPKQPKTLPGSIAGSLDWAGRWLPSTQPCCWCSSPLASTSQRQEWQSFSQQPGGRGPGIQGFLCYTGRGPRGSGYSARIGAARRSMAARPSQWTWSGLQHCTRPRSSAGKCRAGNRIFWGVVSLSTSAPLWA